MLRNLLITCLCLFAFGSVYGQIAVSGRVLENKTRIVLRGVRVENLNNKLKTITDDKGQFGIAAKVGDILVFSAFAYQADTLVLTNMFSREVFLEPKRNMLNQVTITDSSGRAKANPNAVPAYDPEYHGQTMVYQRDARGYYKGGIALRLHYYTKDDKRKRKAAEIVKDRETSELISSLFVPANIEQYVPLKGSDMDDFILLYTPEVRTYNAKNFSMVTYLNACYKEWLTLTPEQRKSAHIFEKQ